MDCCQENSIWVLKLTINSGLHTYLRKDDGNSSKNPNLLTSHFIDIRRTLLVMPKQVVFALLQPVWHNLINDLLNKERFTFLCLCLCSYHRLDCHGILDRLYNQKKRVLKVTTNVTSHLSNEGRTELHTNCLVLSSYKVAFLTFNGQYFHTQKLKVILNGILTGIILSFVSISYHS